MCSLPYIFWVAELINSKTLYKWNKYVFPCQTILSSILKLHWLENFVHKCQYL
jgi:hypothetical protein